MLTHDEYKRLLLLKGQFQKIIGLVDFQLSDDQLAEILRRFKEIPQNQQNIPLLQTIVRQVIGNVKFLWQEALDLSDIETIQKEIEDLLNRK